MRAYPTSDIKLRQTPPTVLNSTHCLIFPSSMAPTLISATSSSSTSSFGCIDNFPRPPTSIPTNRQALSLIPQLISFIRHLRIRQCHTQIPIISTFPSTLLIPLVDDQVRHIDLEKTFQGREWARDTSELWNEVPDSFALQFGKTARQIITRNKFLRATSLILRSETSACDA